MHIKAQICTSFTVAKDVAVVVGVWGCLFTRQVAVPLDESHVKAVVRVRSPLRRGRILVFCVASFIELCPNHRPNRRQHESSHPISSDTHGALHHDRDQNQQYYPHHEPPSHSPPAHPGPLEYAGYCRVPAGSAAPWDRRPQKPTYSSRRFGLATVHCPSLWMAQRTWRHNSSRTSPRAKRCGPKLLAHSSLWTAVTLLPTLPPPSKFLSSNHCTDRPYPPSLDLPVRRFRRSGKVPEGGAGDVGITVEGAVGSGGHTVVVEDVVCGPIGLH